MDTPQQVTRFYSKVEYAMDVIKNRQVAFVHVSKLNDPFDPYCFFETDFGDSYANLIAHVEKNHPRDSLRFRERVTSKNWGRAITKLKAKLRMVRKTAFVLSTSATDSGLHPKDNLYMWGHYANGHRGLAIEFDTRALASAVLRHQQAENGKPSEERNVWAKIEYTKTFSPISAEQIYEHLKQEIEKAPIKVTTQLDMYFSRMTIIKSDIWQGENEWRLMYGNVDINEKIYKCPIGEYTVSSIFLGMNLATEKTVELELIAAAKQNFPAASIFRAYKRHGDLALEFRRL